MLKRLSMIGIAGAMLLLSGCASKPSAMVHKKKDEAPTAYVKVRNGSGAPSWSYNESKAFRNVLEAAAETTMARGYKYFAITHPLDIANTKGSLKNTAKELIEACSPSSAMVLNIPGGGGLHKCGVYNTNASLSIIMYNEEQNDFTVINAEEVIAYMKANDLYDGEGVDIKTR